MKAITLTQPWATLVAIGAKRIETRSWSTSYRGKIAIHAAKGFPSEAKGFCEAQLVCRAMGWPECPNPLTQEWLDDNARRIKSLPLGRVLATASIVNCIRTELILDYVRPMTVQEEAFGNYERGRFGFLLDNIVPLAVPIPAKGALGLWEWAA
jgi:activating signal cointegrator 1